MQHSSQFEKSICSIKIIRLFLESEKKKKEGRGDDGINLGLIDRSRARLRASALSADTSSRDRNV